MALYAGWFLDRRRLNGYSMLKCRRGKEKQEFVSTACALHVNGVVFVPRGNADVYEGECATHTYLHTLVHVVTQEACAVKRSRVWRLETRFCVCFYSWEWKRKKRRDEGSEPRSSADWATVFSFIKFKVFTPLRTAKLSCIYSRTACEAAVAVQCVQSRSCSLWPWWNNKGIVCSCARAHACLCMSMCVCKTVPV